MVNALSKTGLLDLDAMLHIVANVQFKQGNLGSVNTVKQHVFRFINTIKTNSKCKDFVSFYQTEEITNFRNTLLPEYKGHRVRSDAISQWKETILEAFKESGAIGLNHIESDDACSVLARKLGYDNVVIVSSDKDMIQIPTYHYNPYKKGKTYDLSRWYYSHPNSAEKFFWQQVMAGDSTDMPNSMCGIEGVGLKTAETTIGKRKDFIKVVKEQYTMKYGNEGLARASITFRMVRLLDGSSADNYASKPALEEVAFIKENWKNFLVDKSDPVTRLFGTTNIKNLFL